LRIGDVSKMTTNEQHVGELARQPLGGIIRGV